MIEAIQDITRTIILKQINDKSYRDIIARMKDWQTALIQQGYANWLTQQGITPVVQPTPPQTEETISEMEQTLGFRFPESYRIFLKEVGSLCWGNWQKTIPLQEIPQHTEYLKIILNTFTEPPEVIARFMNHLCVLPVLMLDGNYEFFLCNALNENQEAVSYTVYHDEAWLYPGPADFYEWLDLKVCSSMFIASGF